MHVRQVFTPLFAAAALAGSLIADPIPSYVATSASLTWTTLFEDSLPPLNKGEDFSFSGLGLNLSGGGGSGAGDFPFDMTPGVPFVFAPFIVDASDNGSISGTIGGITDTFVPGTGDRLAAPAMVFNLPGGQVPPPFALDMPPITVPATAAGTVMLCAPITCRYNPPETQAKLTMDIPGILTLQIVNIATFDYQNYPMFAVSSAQFTTAPEPNTAVLLPVAIAVSLCYVRRRRTQ